MICPVEQAPGHHREHRRRMDEQDYDQRPIAPQEPVDALRWFGGKRRQPAATPDEFGGGQQHHDAPARRLHKGVVRRDRCGTVTAPPPQPEPAQNRNIVSRADGRAASRATGTGRHHRLPPRQAVHDDINKTAEHRPPGEPEQDRDPLGPWPGGDPLEETGSRHVSMSAGSGTVIPLGYRPNDPRARSRTELP